MAADSLVAIYWDLLATKETVNVYTWNRVENIRSNILIATELYHIAGKHNPADLGTRWRSMNTEMSTNNQKLLTCEMVSPDSRFFCGLPWMQDLEQAERDEILTSTPTILNRNTQLRDEESNNYNKAFKPIPTTTAGDEIKLINEQGVTAWSNKTTGKPDPDQLYLPTLMADLTEIETDTEEDYWENVSLILT